MYVCMYVLMSMQLKKILLQSGRGVNGQCFRAGLNTCMLWLKTLILDGRAMYCLVNCKSHTFLVASEIRI